MSERSVHHSTLIHRLRVPVFPLIAGVDKAMRSWRQIAGLRVLGLSSCVHSHVTQLSEALFKALFWETTHPPVMWASCSCETGSGTIGPQQSVLKSTRAQRPNGRNAGKATKTNQTNKSNHEFRARRCSQATRALLREAVKCKSTDSSGIGIMGCRRDVARTICVHVQKHCIWHTVQVPVERPKHSQIEVGTKARLPLQNEKHA